MVISNRVTKKQEEFVSGKKKKKVLQTYPIILRVPQDMLDKIEEAIEDRPVKISRNTWFLEAAHRYLKD